MKRALILCALALCLAALPLCARPALAESAAPDFTAVDQYGQAWTLSQQRSRAVLLHFWTTWYAWCDRDLAELEACYLEAGANQGNVLILGVASPGVRDSASAEEIAAFLARRGVTCPVLMDTDGAIYAQYAPVDLPTTYFVSPAGAMLGYCPGPAERNTLRQLVSIASGN